MTIDHDIDSVYNAFKIVIEWHINLFVPQKHVTLSSNTPTFVTPLIKSLLRKHNKLMRCGQVQKADDLTTKIGRLISDKRRSLLSKFDVNCTKQLWNVVKASHGQIDVIGQILSNIGDVNFIIKYCTDIAKDAAYDRLEITK